MPSVHVKATSGRNDGEVAKEHIYDLACLQKSLSSQGSNIAQTLTVLTGMDLGWYAESVGDDTWTSMQALESHASKSRAKSNGLQLAELISKLTAFGII